MYFQMNMHKNVRKNTFKFAMFVSLLCSARGINKYYLVHSISKTNLPS